MNNLPPKVMTPANVIQAKVGASIPASSLLPLENTEPFYSITDYKFLVHSLSGVGKTCFGLSIPNYLLLDTERGSLSHSGRIVQIESWDHFTKIVAELRKGKHPYKGIVIDPLDGLYGHAWAHTVKTLGVEHPGDAGHGKGWERITSALFDQLNVLQMTKLGIVCTCHSMVGTVRIKNIEYNKFQPALVGGSARSTYQRVIDFMDIIGYLRMESMVKSEKPGEIDTLPTGKLIEEEKRVLDFSASQFWVTKDRTGWLSKAITLPSDWKEDWPTIESEWKSAQERANTKEESA